MFDNDFFFFSLSCWYHVHTIQSDTLPNINTIENFEYVDIFGARGEIGGLAH